MHIHEVAEEALVLYITIGILQRFNVRLSEDGAGPILRNLHTGPLVANHLQSQLSLSTVAYSLGSLFDNSLCCGCCGRMALVARLSKCRRAQNVLHGDVDGRHCYANPDFCR